MLKPYKREVSQSTRWESDIDSREGDLNSEKQRGFGDSPLN